MNSPMADKRQLLRSCERCRKAKTRCLPDAETEDQCQRCHRLKRDCVFEEVRVRSRPNKVSNQARVVELEKRIDHLTSLLGPSDQSLKKVSPPLSAESEPPTSRSPLKDIQQPILLTPESQLTTGNTPTSAVEPSDLWGSPVVIDKGIITLEQASDFITTFRRLTAGFPFLVIPDLDVAAFRWQRPCLFLAVLVAASSTSYELQPPLDREFRNYVSQKTIVDGVRSLDLSQGLLCYLAWFYQRCSGPEKHDFVLCQMAATMALDSDFEKLAAGDAENEASCEAKRTLVGTYYYASSCAAILHKPTSIRSSFKLWDCSRVLAAQKRVPTDVFLVHYVHLQGLVEEISDAFGYWDSNNQGSAAVGGIEGIEFRVKAFEHRLFQMRVSIQNRDTVPLSLPFACHSVALHLHEACLHIPAIAKAPQAEGETRRLSPQSLTSLSNLLWACLGSAQTVLDAVLKFARDQLQVKTTVEKARTAHAIFVLIKLSFVRIPGLNGYPLREASRVSEYLDKVSTVIGEDPYETTSPEGQMSPAAHFGNAMRSVKSWYERAASMAALGEPSLASDEITGMSPWKLVELANNESLFTLLSQDPNFWLSSNLDFDGAQVV